MGLSNESKRMMSIAFPVWTIEGLKELAEFQGTSVTAVVNLAVTEHLKKNHVDVARLKTTWEYECKFGDKP